MTCLFSKNYYLIDQGQVTHSELTLWPSICMSRQGGGSDSAELHLQPRPRIPPAGVAQQGQGARHQVDHQVSTVQYSTVQYSQ